MLEAAMALYAGISALMATIQVLQKERDYRVAERRFDEEYERLLKSEETVRAAKALAEVSAPEEIEILLDRAKKCWEYWREVSRSREKYLPGEQKEADKAVKICVCRELNRIEDLFGEDAIPDEWQKQRDRYECSLMLVTPRMLA